MSGQYKRWRREENFVFSKAPGPFPGASRRSPNKTTASTIHPSRVGTGTSLRRCGPGYRRIPKGVARGGARCRCSVPVPIGSRDRSAWGQAQSSFGDRHMRRHMHNWGQAYAQRAQPSRFQLTVTSCRVPVPASSRRRSKAVGGRHVVGLGLGRGAYLLPVPSGAAACPKGGRGRFSVPVPRLRLGTRLGTGTEWHRIGGGQTGWPASPAG